jgi:hypothetical protein
MPSYDNSPFKRPPAILIPGQSSYLFGSWKQNASPTQIQVASVAIAADVATVTGTIYGGDVPTVGSLISIRGTQTGGGTFNVTNATIVSVVFVAATSGVTITFALASGNVATTADAGKALAPQPEVAENVVAGTASIACTVQQNETFLQGGRQVSATVLGTATLKLQGANFDQDSEYTDLGACTTGAVTQFTASNFKFYRCMPTASGTAVARIEG